jgi:S-formylglutathione hydrolase FrmB
VSSALVVVGEPLTLSARLTEWTLASAALASTTKLRILLPVDYSADARRRFPVVYLFHGGGGGHGDWTDPSAGDAEALTDGLGALVVMPDGSPNGYYTNWFNGGAYGPPAWETFHLDELIPWVDAHFRTIARRSGRATAGVSMGGGGLRYAARRPDLVGVTASFSGAIDITHRGLGIHSPIAADLAARIFGDFSVEEVRWRGANGADLAVNLAHTDVSLYTGDEDSPEDVIMEGTVSTHLRLVEQGIEHRFRVFHGMTHSWVTFRRGFAEWLEHLATWPVVEDLPSRFTFASIAAGYDVYGWSVHMARDVVEFSALEVAGGGEFAVTGSGPATVRTARVAAPGAAVRVTVTGRRGGSWVADADESGRLIVPLDLGPGNPHQQFSVAAASSGGAGPDEVPFPTRRDGSRFARTDVSIVVL